MGNTRVVIEIRNQLSTPHFSANPFSATLRRHGPFSRPAPEDEPPIGSQNLRVIAKDSLVPLVECPITGSRSLLGYKTFNVLHDQAQAFYALGTPPAVRGHYRAAATRYGTSCLPVPWTRGEDYGLKFTLGSDEITLDDSDPKWARVPDPTDPDQLDAWDNPLTLGLLSPSNTSTIDFWWTPLNEWLRNYGLSNRPLRSRSTTWRIENTGSTSVFEPINPWDTANFKITRGEFSGPEIAPSQFSSSPRQDLVIFLVPRLWSYSVTGVEWAFRYAIAGPPLNAVEKRNYSQSGLVYPLTAPAYTSRVSNNPPVSLADMDLSLVARTPVGGGSPPTFSSSTSVVPVAVSGVPRLQGGYGPDPSYGDADTNFLRKWLATHSLGIPRGSGYDDNDTIYSGSFPEEEGDVTALLELSNCVLDLEVAPTQAESLAGVFSTWDGLFYVYRKTELAGGGSIYSGAYDGVSSTDNLIRVLDDVLIGTTMSFPGFPTIGPVSSSRDFTYWDPDGLWLHESY